MFDFLFGKRILIRSSGNGKRQIEIKGPIPLSCHPAIRDFFEKTPVESGKVAIRGDWGRNLKVRFSRDIPGEYHQRIRNFLHSIRG